jgi:hypothetical protein
MTDIFGGHERYDAHGHHWVGTGTPVEHCMSCRIGPANALALENCSKTAYCVCGRHLDEHQPSGAAATCSFKKAEVTP